MEPKALLSTALLAAVLAGGCDAPSGKHDESKVDCASCHMPEYESVKHPQHAGVFPTTCQECHNSDAWHPTKPRPVAEPSGPSEQPTAPGASSPGTTTTAPTKATSTGPTPKPTTTTPTPKPTSTVPTPKPTNTTPVPRPTPTIPITGASRR